jgi:hypothetical protein
MAPAVTLIEIVFSMTLVKNSIIRRSVLFYIQLNRF